MKPNTNSVNRRRTFTMIFVAYVLLSIFWSPYINVLALVILSGFIVLLCKLRKATLRKLILGCLLLYVALSYRFIPDLKDYSAMVKGHKDATLSPYKPGMDNLIYFTGSQIQLEYGANAYDNEVTLQYIRDGRIKQHTNPKINVNAIDLYERQGFGYVGTPVTLWLYYRLFVRWMSFDKAIILWAALSLTVMLGAVALFAWKLSRERSKVARIGELLIVSSLLVFSFQPAIQSLVTGNIEALYLLPMALGIYLFAFKTDSTRSIYVASLLLAIATAIKIFPGIVMGYFVIVLLKRMVRGWRDGTLSLREIFQFVETKAIMAYALGLFALFVVSLQQVGWDTIVAWWHKMGAFRQIASIQISSPSLVSYLNLWYYNSVGNHSTTVAGDDMLLVVEKLKYVHWVAVVGIGFLISWFVALVNQGETAKDGINRKRWLMYTAIVLAALPTLSPHFWNLYLVTVSAGLVIVYSYSRDIEEQWKRALVQTLLLASLVCMNEYFYKLVFSIVDVVFDLHHRHPLSTSFYDFNLWFLNTTPEAPDAVSLLSPYRAIIGYPGPLLTLIAALIVGYHKGDHAQV